MKKIVAMIGLAVFWALAAHAQTAARKVYDERINPLEQIDQALVRARSENKFVVCQLGGNWCPWCLRFADFIAGDSVISQVVSENFVYIHVNYNPRKSASSESALQSQTLLKRLNHPERFGFPVLVVLDHEGRVIHVQDSSFLEEGQGYHREKVLRFFNSWTPRAIRE